MQGEQSRRFTPLMHAANRFPAANTLLGFSSTAIVSCLQYTHISLPYKHVVVDYAALIWVCSCKTLCGDDFLWTFFSSPMSRKTPPGRITGPAPCHYNQGLQDQAIATGHSS
jgi:hypothetical protein